ncbi:MAG: hypothetical protein IKB34_00115 [Clostridia bacterium]|nr:hypothetical protein [Clostridia bacterium]
MWFFGKKKKTDYLDGRKMAEKLNGKHIKYVTERKDDEDTVIGRDGALIVKGDEFLVFSSADVVFRCHIDELQASELLSLEGVIINAPDIEHGGEFRTVIAYYTYYIK